MMTQFVILGFKNVSLSRSCGIPSLNCMFEIVAFILSNKDCHLLYRHSVGIGVGIGTGIGVGVGMGLGAGVGVGIGAGIDVSVDVSIGACIGVGIGIDASIYFNNICFLRSLYLEQPTEHLSQKWYLGIMDVVLITIK